MVHPGEKDDAVRMDLAVGKREMERVNDPLSLNVIPFGVTHNFSLDKVYSLLCDIGCMISDAFKVARNQEEIDQVS